MSNSAEDGPSGLSFRRLIRFSGRNAVYFALLPLVVIWGTFVHELAHALASVAQGGQILKFQILPSFDLGYFTFGYIRHTAPEDADYALISLAPCLLAVVFALVTGLILLRSRSAVVLRIVFIFFFLLPLVDLSLSLSGLVAGREEVDLFWLFSDHVVLVTILMAGVLAVFGVLGRYAFRRCWTRELSGTDFAVGYAVILLLPWLSQALR